MLFNTNFWTFLYMTYEVSSLKTPLNINFRPSRLYLSEIGQFWTFFFTYIHEYLVDVQKFFVLNKCSKIIALKSIMFLIVLHWNFNFLFVILSINSSQGTIPSYCSSRQSEAKLQGQRYPLCKIITLKFCYISCFQCALNPYEKGSES